MIFSVLFFIIFFKQVCKVEWMGDGEDQERPCHCHLGCCLGLCYFSFLLEDPLDYSCILHHQKMCGTNRGRACWGLHALKLAANSVVMGGLFEANGLPMHPGAPFPSLFLFSLFLSSLLLTVIFYQNVFTGWDFLPYGVGILMICAFEMGGRAMDG